MRCDVDRSELWVVSRAAADPFEQLHIAYSRYHAN